MSAHDRPSRLHRRRLRLRRRRAAAAAARAIPQRRDRPGHFRARTPANTSTASTRTSGPRRGQPLTPLHLARDRARAVRRALSGAAARRGPAAASSSSPSLAGRIVDLSADFRLRDAGRLRALLRRAARGARLAGSLRLRPAGAEPRGHPQRALRQRRRLQRDGLDPGAAARRARRPAASGTASRGRRQGRLLGRRRIGERGLAPPRAQRRGALLRADRPPPRGRGERRRSGVEDVHLSVTPSSWCAACWRRRTPGSRPA